MTVSMQGCIREMHAGGLSAREVSRRLGVSRNTVARYLAKQDFSPPPPAAPERAQPAMEGYAEIAGSWLEADGSAPRKQRHTARRVWERLRDEEGYTGSLSTVERFVRRWREEHRWEGDGFLEPGWPPGTAQVDYGQCEAVVAGVPETLHALALTFPHSNARFEVLTRRQRSENACWALCELFEEVGRAPVRLVLDNATELGRRRGGEVSESSLFSALRAHYGCSSSYCNPASGHEKGSVENAVGFLGRNLMVPVPRVGSLEELNARVLSGCRSLLSREHYRLRGRTVGQLLEEDLAACRPLPAARFDAVRWERRRADKEGRVRVDGSCYLAGPYWHGREMLVGLRDSTVEILDARGRRVALLPRSYEEGASVRDPACLLPALTARPRAWPESPLRSEVPGALRDALDACGAAERRSVLRAILRASEACGFEAAARAAGDICASGRLPDDASCDLLARRIAAGEPAGPASCDLSVYDLLAGEAV